MIMANTNDVQGKIANNNNSSADDFQGNLEGNSVNDSGTNAMTNRIDNNDAIENLASSEASPLMRYFDFDESNYSYVVGYN